MNETFYEPGEFHIKIEFYEWTHPDGKTDYYIPYIFFIDKKSEKVFAVTALNPVSNPHREAKKLYRFFQSRCQIPVPPSYKIQKELHFESINNGDECDDECDDDVVFYAEL